MATCGQYGFCGANAPIPCYTCNHFQPWLDGPHEEVLADLLAERDQVFKLTGDSVMAAVNDRSILAVVNVIQRCEARRAELMQMTLKTGGMRGLGHFSPKSNLAASANLAEFIRMCKEDLTVFGAGLAWEATAWPKAINFTKLGAKNEGFMRRIVWTKSLSISRKRISGINKATSLPLQKTSLGFCE